MIPRRAVQRLGRPQRRALLLMGSVVLALHAVGFFLLIVVIAPHHYALGRSGAFAIGTGLTAYTLGLRHAVDADHIAAIDNTTRKLMAEGQRPVSVGFWFSLGHCTVVFALALLLAVGVRWLDGPVAHPGSSLHDVAGLIGTGVSGGFLFLIAGLNLAILWGILRVWFEMRQGRYDEAALEHHLSARGLMNRLLRRWSRSVASPRQMYPVGVLFGLGFDTATEVALLFLAAGAAGAGLPFYAILCLPILFAAGMSLLDTIDGSFMNFAYGWAFSKPIRKVFYNLVITSLSVAVAFVIGFIEVGGVFAQKLRVRGGFWSWLEHIDISSLGLIIVAMFILTWVAALAIWRFGHVEERWTARCGSGEPV